VFYNTPNILVQWYMYIIYKDINIHILGVHARKHFPGAQSKKFGDHWFTASPTVSSNFSKSNDSLP